MTAALKILSTGTERMQKINFKMVEITPEMAQIFLSQNNSNRNVRARKVDEYKKSMDKGFWRVTGDGISLDPDGKLLDGQHRLLAIIAHGKPVTMAVIKNVESGVQQYMDCGTPRRVADNLKMFDGEKNSGMLVTLAKALVLFDTGDFETMVIDDVRKVMKKYKDQIIWFQANLTKELPRSAYFYAPLLWLHKHGYSDEASMFLDEMATLEGLTKGSPVIALTKVLEKKKSNKSRQGLKPLAIAMYTFNALRAYCEEDSLQAKQLMPSAKGFDYFNSEIKTFSKRRNKKTCAWNKGCTFKKATRGAGVYDNCWLHEHVRNKRD